MELKGSATEQNLKDAFAGESDMALVRRHGAKFNANGSIEGDFEKSIGFKFE